MIPRILHYCWFGPNPIPEQLLIYINSWKSFCPNYEIKLWNEDSFDINSHPFTKSAYSCKKYAYVSDYVRAFALLNYGGIYLDSDVELKENLDVFLDHEAFTGFESKGYPFTAVWGAKPFHSLSQKVVDYYSNKVYTEDEITNTASVTNILVKDFRINPLDNHLQIGCDNKDTIHIYPSTTFCLDLPKNYASHHFYGSWLPDDKRNAKSIIHDLYLFEEIINSKNNINTPILLRIISNEITFRNLLKVIRRVIKRIILG